MGREWKKDSRGESRQNKLAADVLSYLFNNAFPLGRRLIFRHFSCFHPCWLCSKRTLRHLSLRPGCWAISGQRAICAQNKSRLCLVLWVEMHRVEVQVFSLSEWSSSSRRLWLPTAWLTPPSCPCGASLESDRQDCAKWAVTWFMGHSACVRGVCTDFHRPPYLKAFLTLFTPRISTSCSLLVFALTAPAAVKVTSAPLDCRRPIDSPSFAWISLSEYYVMRHLSSFIVIPERGRVSDCGRRVSACSRGA